MTYYNICISYWKLMCHWSLILLIRRVDMTCVPWQFHLSLFTKHRNVLCLFSVPLLFIACSSSYIWLKSVNCELCCAHMLLLLWRSKTTWFYFIFINDLNRVAVIINDCDFAITTIVASTVIVRETDSFVIHVVEREIARNWLHVVYMDDVSYIRMCLNITNMLHI